MPITVDVRTLPAITVACLHHSGSPDDFAAALRDAVAQAQAHGLADATAHPVRLCHDPAAPTDSTARRFDAGVAVADPAADCGPLDRVTVRGGSFAVALHRGPYTGIPRTYAWLLESWLPDSGYDRRAGPAVEVYLNDPHTTPEADLLAEVRLPIRPR